MKLILIGFMGSGKTTISKALGKKFNLEVIEMDDIVLKKSGRSSVSEIFDKDGERRFREIEIEVAKNLSSKNNCIISTGGGVIINKIIIDYLIQQGKVVFLKTSFEEIKKRLSKDDNINRPLFKDKKLMKKIFNFRQLLYEEYADLIINTDNKTVNEIVNYLANLL